VTAPGKIGFDDDGKPVGVTEFDFAALDAKGELAEARERIAELEAQLNVAKRDRVAGVAYYRDKLPEFVRFTCDALLAGNPSAETAGRRAYFFALLLKQSSFSSQAELARHLDLSEGRISQELKAFKRENPLFIAVNGE
jgi:hypothetical protein